MSLTDDELLDFDRTILAKPPDGERLLDEHGEVYRAQLVAARWIEGWRERLGESMRLSTDQTFDDGVNFTLDNLAAHLRQGDLLPGGKLYEEEVKR